MEKGCKSAQCFKYIKYFSLRSRFLILRLMSQGSFVHALIKGNKISDLDRLKTEFIKPNNFVQFLYSFQIIKISKMILIMHSEF